MKRAGTGAPVSAPLAAPEEDPEAVWLAAAEAYEAADHARAVELYRRLLERGFGGAALQYNLGNAYLRTGELGRAIASYRRSLAAAPRDQDTAANLSFARQSRKDAIAAPGPSPVLRALFFWHYAVSQGERRVAAAILYLALFAALVARLYRSRSELLGWVAGAAAVGFLAVAGSLAAEAWWPLEVAVVLPQEIEARTAPDVDSVVRFKLHAGTEVRVADRRDGWLRIELPDGQQGWVEAGAAEVVSG